MRTEIERIAEACYEAWRRHQDRVQPIRTEKFRYGGNDVGGHVRVRPRWDRLLREEQSVWYAVAEAAIKAQVAGTGAR